MSIKFGESGYWVWAEAMDLLEGAERAQRRLFAVARAQAPPCWVPAVDMFEQGDELNLIVALPGVLREQVEVVLDLAGLVVRGHRPLPTAFRRASMHRLEIPYGRFERRIALPAGNYRLLRQSVEDGCLALVLRRL